MEDYDYGEWRDFEKEERLSEYADDPCPYCGYADACDCMDDSDGEDADHEDEEGFL